MIGNLLDFVAQQLNRYVCLKQGISVEESKVQLSLLVDQSGSVASNEENVVLLSLVDTSKNSLAYSNKQMPNGMGGVNTEIDHMALHLDLKLLFSAYFKQDRAKDALNMLTLVMQFFQSKPTFTKENSPGMPDGVKKLEFTMETVGCQEQSHMWGILGAKYMPSAVYTMKMISFFDAREADPITPILTIDEEVQ